MNRRAKIVATLGPASADERTIARLLKAGVDVVRLNLSHGSAGDHRRLLERVRRLAESMERHVPVIFDLRGPRYRLGTIREGERSLRARHRVSLGHESEEVDVPIDDARLLRYLKPRDRVLIDNGLIELRIEEATRNRATARVISGGAIATRKGINLPDSDLPFEVSAKDRADIRLAVEEGGDYLAASYVGRAADLEALRSAMRDAGGSLPLIAKLERSRALEHLEEVVASADAVMVARGDLGVEVPLHLVPVWQKRIVDAGRHHGKPVIVATQMLESMIDHPRPTRAESSDVANAVFDGADALMLSGETAAGSYPVKSVRTMAQIIREAETYLASRESGSRVRLLESAGSTLTETPRGTSGSISAPGGFPEVANALARAAVFTARHLGIREIVVFSQSGFTARLISRYRPSVPILAFTPDALVARQVQLLWGVHPLVLNEELRDHGQIVELVEGHLRSARLVRPGDRLIILMGEPIREKPLTNLMRVHQVGS